MALYQQTIPGVVTILVTTSQGEALGSGFVYDAQGHIVTNDHVVQGAQNNKVEVDFNSGFKTYGTVIGTDPDSDLAIIKVDAPASELHPLTIGDSNAIKSRTDYGCHRQSIWRKWNDDGWHRFRVNPNRPVIAFN